jgi:hypothetical protein
MAMKVKASSFADPADIRAFRQCKFEGHSDKYCFQFGDNGIGAWGDDTTSPFPMCALPRDDWKGIAAPRLRGVVVNVGDKEITCLLADTMPWKRNIKNGAGIDLNLEACKMLGLKPPIMVDAEWRWA